jgi:hypothetical protein
MSALAEVGAPFKKGAVTRLALEAAGVPRSFLTTTYSLHHQFFVTTSLPGTRISTSLKRNFPFISMATNPSVSISKC